MFTTTVLLWRAFKHTREEAYDGFYEGNYDNLLGRLLGL